MAKITLLCGALLGGTVVARTNLLAGWLGIFAGFAAGAVPGLFFWMEDWLGGYASWRRRLVRLGHISFFGLGFINVLFGLTVTAAALTESAALRWSSALLVAGAAAMPAVCYLAAWRQPFRHLFFVPVACMMLGVALFLAEGWLR